MSEDEYRRRAEEAEQLAKAAQTDDECRAYRKIAEGWRNLEQEARRRVARGF